MQASEAKELLNANKTVKQMAITKWIEAMVRKNKFFAERDGSYKLHVYPSTIREQNWDQKIFENVLTALGYSVTLFTEDRPCGDTYYIVSIN